MAGGPTPRYVWYPAHRFFRWSIKRKLQFQIEGLEHVPRSGSAMLVARHFHHYWDGAILSATFDRSIHIVVGLDWSQGIGRRLLERVCRATRFPIILRTDDPAPGPKSGPAVPPDEARRYLRRAVADTVDLLKAGNLVIVFPEAYPTIDPHGSRKPDRDAFLPFRPGFVQLVAHAQRAGAPPVPIIPVGFEYEPLDPDEKRWRVVARFGEPLFLSPGADRTKMMADVETRVRTLSGYRPT